METFLSIAPNQLKNIYNSLITSKIKEKKNIILEPIQAMIQLALISFCPVGTKITIQNNILSFQQPTVIQPISRWYNYDRKDDIYHLFQVIKRFIKWHLNNMKFEKKFYETLVEQSIIGIDVIMKTYQDTEMLTIIPVLQMYKDLLTNSDKKQDEQIETKTAKIAQLNRNIDEVFINISSIYDKNTINIVHNVMLLLKNEKNPTEINNLISGLNIILTNINVKIKSWINDNLLV